MGKNNLTMFGFAIFILLLALPFSSAYRIDSYSAEYDLNEQNAFVTISLVFDSPTDDFSWRLPKDATQITSTQSGLVVKEGRDYKTIIVNSSINETEFSYVTTSLIDHQEDYFFILDFSGIYASSHSILLKLPEDAKLRYTLDSGQSAILPKTTAVLTDGRRIIIRWTEKDFSASQALLVIYELPKNSSIFYLALIGSLFIIGMGALGFYFYSKKNIFNKSMETPNKKAKDKTKDVKDDITRNLFEEERLIVETLLNEKTKELWQKQLEHKTGLNKVRLSRKLRSLESRGIIEKIPYGNTNKVRLKDK